MKNLSFLIFLLSFLNTKAQYLYKDLIAANEITQLKKSFADYGINKIISTGYTPNGNAFSDYTEIQEHDILNNQIIISTTENRSVTILIYKFDSLGKIESIVDSSSNVISYTIYKYDQSGNITEINNTMIDSLKIFAQNESHFWKYKDGRPGNMWRIINKNDSMEVRFDLDEKGNVIGEKNFRKSKLIDEIYYYYDEKNRLTDIVRYNQKAKKLLPDYMFEYDDQNHIIQKITTTSTQSAGYLTWRYLYNEKGLKTKEALFNKEKKLLGRIDFTYN